MLAKYTIVYQDLQCRKIKWIDLLHSNENKTPAGSNSKSGSSKFVGFWSLIGKFSHFKWLTIVVLIKVLIIVDQNVTNKKKGKKLGKRHNI